ncbi:hypothetical protein U3516DRAFT_821786 [Neocallimastix sp. 'constans']
MGNELIKEEILIKEEEKKICDIYKFYKDENCDIPTRILIYIVLSGFVSIGFLIFCFIIASCFRYKRRKEKRQLELITPVSSEVRLKQCIAKKYPDYRDQKYYYYRSKGLPTKNNYGNNNGNGNSGMMEKENIDYSYNYEDSQRILQREKSPNSVYNVKERTKVRPTERRYANLCSPYQTANYKKIYPVLYYDNNMNHPQGMVRNEVPEMVRTEVPEMPIRNNPVEYNIDCYNIQTSSHRNIGEKNYSRKISLNLNDRSNSKLIDKGKNSSERLINNKKITNDSWNSSDGSNTDDTIVMNNSKSQANLDSKSLMKMKMIEEEDENDNQLDYSIKRNKEQKIYLQSGQSSSAMIQETEQKVEIDKNPITPTANRRISDNNQLKSKPLPPPIKKENIPTNTSNNENYTIINGKKPTVVNNEIEFEEVERFEEVQRPIKEIESKEIRNQQYLNYINNINSNLNLPTYSNSTSLEIADDLIELEKTNIYNSSRNTTANGHSKIKNHNRKRSKNNTKKKEIEPISNQDDKIHNENENHLKRNILNNPIVQKSSHKGNGYNYQQHNRNIDLNAIQNRPSTSYNTNDINHQYSTQQIPITPTYEDYANSPDYYYNLSPANDPNNEMLYSNLSQTHRPTSKEINYELNSRPNSSSYSNSDESDSPALSYKTEESEYNEFPPRRIPSSTYNNIPGPPPTASSTYKGNNNNLRPVCRREDSNYFNQDLSDNNDPDDPDYPGYSGYQSPSYYDNSQNQMYMNNLVIPFQKPKVCVREAPILKNSHNNK